MAPFTSASAAAPRTPSGVVRTHALTAARAVVDQAVAAPDLPSHVAGGAAQHARQRQAALHRQPQADVARQTVRDIAFAGEVVEHAFEPPQGAWLFARGMKARQGRDTCRRPGGSMRSTTARPRAAGTRPLHLCDRLESVKSPTSRQSLQPSARQHYPFALTHMLKLA